MTPTENYCLAGQGVAGHYYRIAKKNYWVKENYKRIVYAIDSDFNMAEVSYQFYAEKYEDVNKWSGHSELQTYIIKLFKNWYTDKVRHLDVQKRNKLKVSQEIKEITMNNHIRETEWRRLMQALSWCCETRDERALVMWRLKLTDAPETAARLGITTQALTYRWKKLSQKIKEHMDGGQYWDTAFRGEGK